MDRLEFSQDEISTIESWGRVIAGVKDLEKRKTGFELLGQMVFNVMEDRKWKSNIQNTLLKD